MDNQVSLIACRILNNLFNDEFIKTLPEISKEETINRILLECVVDLLIILKDKHNVPLKVSYTVVGERLKYIIQDRLDNSQDLN